MNAGGSHGSLSGSVLGLKVVADAGEVLQLGLEYLAFGYRSFEVLREGASGGPGGLITSVELRVTRETPKEVDRRFRRILAEKRATQPMAERSAGCCFRNPGGGAEPAGKLIDAAGLKGFRLGTAEVSPLHANFVTLDPGGRTDDVAALLDHVAAEVHRVHGVTLRRELVIW